MPPSPALNPSRYHESVPRIGLSIKLTRNDLPRLTAQRKTAMAAMTTKTGKVMYDTAYQRCPVQTGYMRSTIRNVTVISPPTYVASLVIGAYYWKWVNYGADGRSGKPFATQASEAGRRTVESESARINSLAVGMAA